MSDGLPEELSRAGMLRDAAQARLAHRRRYVGHQSAEDRLLGLLLAAADLRSAGLAAAVETYANTPITGRKPRPVSGHR